ncbi:glycoside hydrolase family 88 protein [Paenibacillus aurantius]|uniref:Glycoside hydrolase family 88 protein n=1 Tax=Paenibacillus aurantius TaxID=2918900 RepID=A0AA96RHZ0_9BACL|nr:glycoside hydrolase family 88 protein [Paenibacillus aurantius]WNQ13903.1 glycoside hydrolase family 88 protein [Paenibacillus aurantius]
MMIRPLPREETESLIQKVISGMQNLEITIQEDTPVSIISMDKWDWSQGVGLFSLYRYYLETGNESILSYLTGWFDARLKEGLPAKNVNTMCPLLTLSYLYDLTGNPDYLRICEEWASYAADEMPRTMEFGITHNAIDNPNQGELWDDTLYMTVLFMGRMGVLLNKEHYVQESIRQFLVHLKYLTDTRTGLFFHGWTFEGNHNFAKALWGRGNAWYTAGLVDFLDIIQLPHGVEFFLLSSLERQVQKLAELQSPNGLWHTLLDDPTSYEETSATAGFAYGILKAIRKGYLSEEYREVGMKALHAVIGKIDGKGAVHGVSYGTRMGRTLDFYKHIPQCPMPYGQSMTLLMLVESLRHAESLKHVDSL